MWAHETPAKLGLCGVWADARQCLEWGLSAASSGVAIMGRSGVAQPTHPLLTPTSSSLRRRGTVECWPLCTRQAWGPFDVGAAYLHDSEAWSVRNHELATALLESAAECWNVLARGDMQRDPYQAATAAVAESTDTVVVAHPSTPVSCTAGRIGSLIDWCLMSKG